MSCSVNIGMEQVAIPEGCNIIIGQSHFIKTVEDLYEALVTSSPAIEFGIAFCEASGDCLVRHDCNKMFFLYLFFFFFRVINGGKGVVVILRNSFPINVLDRIKNVQEVCRIFTATANPLQVLVAETEQGRGVIGVVDGSKTVGVEDEKGQEWRKDLLRKIIGYKR